MHPSKNGDDAHELLQLQANCSSKRAEIKTYAHGVTGKDNNVVTPGHTSAAEYLEVEKSLKKANNEISKINKEGEEHGLGKNGVVKSRKGGRKKKDNGGVQAMDTGDLAEDSDSSDPDSDSDE